MNDEAKPVPSYGIHELKKVLFFAVESGNVADRLQSEKGWIGKAAAALPLADEFIGLISLDPKKVMLEMKDLSAAEKDELLSLVAEKYNIKDEQKEALVEEGLALVAEMVECAAAMHKYAQKWRK